MLRYAAAYVDTFTNMNSETDVQVEMRRPYRCGWDSEPEALEQLIGFFDERKTDYENERLLGVVLERRVNLGLPYTTRNFHREEVERLTVRRPAHCPNSPLPDSAGNMNNAQGETALSAGMTLNEVPFPSGSLRGRG